MEQMRNEINELIEQSKQKAKVLTEALKELFHADNAIKIIGIRHGEKMYETLLTDEECTSAIDLGRSYMKL